MVWELSYLDGIWIDNFFLVLFLLFSFQVFNSFGEVEFLWFGWKPSIDTLLFFKFLLLVLVKFFKLLLELSNCSTTNVGIFLIDGSLLHLLCEIHFSDKSALSLVIHCLGVDLQLFICLKVNLLKSDVELLRSTNFVTLAVH